jgi:hypothetical protein
MLLLIYTKNTYVFKLFPYVVTAGIEALAVSGNMFCVPVSKKSAACDLSNVLTSSINSSLLLKLWTQPVLQISKQVVVARREIRTVRTVVRQLPVEMLQQCSIASSCMRARIVMEEHCVSAFHADYSEWPYAVLLVFRNTVLTLLWSLVV